MKATLHQMHVLKAVKDRGSITGAAKLLHITQPAVSNILRQLESIYGCAVTETIGKKVYLTPAGECIVEAVKSINQIMDNVDSKILSHDSSLFGTIRVRIVSTAKYFVPKILGAFRKCYPDINIVLTVGNREQTIDAIQHNSDDVYIMSEPPKNMPIHKKAFYYDELVVAVATQFNSSKKRQMALKTLADFEWIIREPGSGTRIAMLSLFKNCKAVPNITMEVSSNESIKQLIMADMGISIVSRQSIELELEHDLIKILPTIGFPIKHPWYLVTCKGKQRSKLVQEFYDFTQSSNYARSCD